MSHDRHTKGLDLDDRPGDLDLVGDSGRIVLNKCGVDFWTVFGRVIVIAGRAARLVVALQRVVMMKR